MIQRIQTIWLAICVILSLILLKVDLVSFTGGNQENLVLGFRGFQLIKVNGNELISSALLIPVTMVFIPLCSAIAIFLYGNRRLQKLLVLLIIFSAVILCATGGFYWLEASKRFKATADLHIKMVLPLIIIISAILAWLGIRNDERLVRSYDRLR